MSVGWWEWGVLVLALAAMLVADFALLGRGGREVGLRAAAAWSAVWFVLGLGFAVPLWAVAGAGTAGEYAAGYLIERSLSLDNVFVFALLFAGLAVPRALERWVLFVGIGLALVLRVVFILAGAALLDAAHWAVYLFAAVLVATGVRMALHRDRPPRPEQGRTLRLLRRLVPMTEGFQGRRLLVRENGRLRATPLLAVLAAFAVTDVVFAVDSIPSIFAITRDPFVVVAANGMALVGLRALYHLVAGMTLRFPHLQTGLAVVLVVVGAKMALESVVAIPIWASLGVVVAILAVSLAAPARSARSADTRPGRGVTEGQV